MPLSNFSAGELSSRHLPDVSEACSNTSFSFQIPGASDTLLADEDPDDFFRAVGTPDDVSMAVAGSSTPQVAPKNLGESPLSKDTQGFLKRDSSTLKDGMGIIQGSNLMEETLHNLSKGHGPHSAIAPYDKPVSATVIAASSLSGASVSKPTRSVPLAADHASGVSVPMTTQSTQDNLRNHEPRPIATQELVQRSNIQELKANKCNKEERAEHGESEGKRKRSLRKQQVCVNSRLIVLRLSHYPVNCLESNRMWSNKIPTYKEHNSAWRFWCCSRFDFDYQCPAPQFENQALREF